MAIQEKDWTLQGREEAGSSKHPSRRELGEMESALPALLLRGSAPCLGSAISPRCRAAGMAFRAL